MPSSSFARRRVVGLLILLFGITYLDRVCISVAGPRIQADLNIGPIGWGWVTGVFAIAYGLFEMPTGMLGDRKGPRRMLTRIVLWWSAFTALTGAVTSFVPLLIARFMFGAGEAGAFPVASVVTSRWFPPSRRATLSGVMLMASQIGGALAPLIVVPIQIHYGWRMSFYVFAVLGLVWAAAWHTWFRDDPPRPTDAAQPHQPVADHSSMTHKFSWAEIFRSRTIMALSGTAFCYVYVYNFFQTWFHTFLVKGRRFDEQGLLLSALPFAVAIISNLSGGMVSDHLVRKLGATRGRRIVGVTALTLAGLFTVAAMLTHDRFLTVVFLALVYGSITFQQSGVFGVCLDVGRTHAGAVVGLMNTVAQAGGLLGSVAYGYIVDHFGSYDAPFVPMACLLFVGALLWLWVDASKQISAQGAAIAQPVI